MSSVLAVRTKRSAKQFARGQRGGIFTPSYACAGHDGVECGGELSDAVADEEPEPGGAFAEVHEEVAGLLGGPGSVGMSGHAEHV